VLSVILRPLGSEGACVHVKPSFSDRGPVDLGIEFLYCGVWMGWEGGFICCVYVGEGSWVRHGCGDVMMNGRRRGQSR